MIVAVLDMVLSPSAELETIAKLQGVFDCARPLPGCSGGGVFQEVGRAGHVLYVETWTASGELENHIRSRAYEALLALMETALQRPTLTFGFVGEARGLEWVERLRLGTAGPAGEAS